MGRSPPAPIMTSLAPLVSKGEAAPPSEVLASPPPAPAAPEVPGPAPAPVADPAPRAEVQPRRNRPTYVAPKDPDFEVLSRVMMRTALTFRVDAELYERIVEACHRHRIKQQELFERAVKETLTRMERNQR